MKTQLKRQNKHQIKRHTHVFLFLGVVTCLGAACGKSGGFKNKGEVPAQETPRPTYVPPPRAQNVEIRGYADPNIQGQDLKYLADGKPKPLQDPVDPDEHAEITQIEQGQATKIGDLKSPVINGSNSINCPSAIVLDGTCIAFQPVFKWKKNDATDESRIVLSNQNEGCNASSEPCKSLVNSIYKTNNIVAFKGILESIATKPELATKIKGITICHGSIGTNGLESVVSDPSSCALSKETFYGFVSQQSSTVPVYQWKKAEFTILSLSQSTAPATGYALSFTDPVFYAAPQ